MALKTKRPVRVKTGVWTNHIKLGIVLNKLSMLYTALFVIMSAVSWFQGQKAMAVTMLILTIPLVIIQYSRIKYEQLIKDERIKSERETIKSETNKDTA